MKHPASSNWNIGTPPDVEAALSLRTQDFLKSLTRTPIRLTVNHFKMEEMELINRADLVKDYEIEIVETETHHNHSIVRLKDGRAAWKENKKVKKLVEEMNLHKIALLFYHIGIDKNSEAYRKLYREIGYPLLGYSELFYCELNNPDVDDYQPPKE